MLEKIFRKTSLTDIFIIVVTSLAVVSFWRGVWGLMDIYLFPENPPLSLIISILSGLVILFAIAFYNPKKR
jgi:hypothetical protein